MIRQDYFIRVIRAFFDALARAMNINDIEDRSKAIHDLYEQYLGEYEYFQNANVEDALEYLKKYPEDQRLDRTEMLAELYYAEADTRIYPINETLLERALTLFEYVDKHGKLYSAERLKKIEDIRRRIEQDSNSTDSTK